jgi:hypothetical protein
MYPFIYI